MYIRNMWQKRAQLSGHEAGIYALTGDFSADSFLSAAGDGYIVRWQLDNPELGNVIGTAGEQIFALEALPDAQVLVAGTFPGGVHWIDLQQPDRSRHVMHHRRAVYDFLRIGEELISAGGEGALSRWSIPARRATETLLLSNQSLRALAYQAERQVLAVGSSDNSIYLLAPHDFSILATISNAHTNSVFSLAFHPNGRYLLSGGRDAQLAVWDIEAGYQLAERIPAHHFTVNAIAFAPDGQQFATGSRDKTVKIWDANTFQLRKVLEIVRSGGHLNSVNSLFWHPSQNVLISGSDDRTIILWAPHSP